MPTPVTDSMEAWLPYQEVRQHARISAMDNDPQLELVAGAAQDAVESVIGAVLHRQVQQEFRGSSSRLALNVLPVLSVQQVSGIPNGDNISHSLDRAAGVVLLEAAPPASGVTVSYTVGRDSVPDAVKMAGLIVAAHIWRTQRANAPDSGSDPYDDMAGYGLGFALPNRALQLLAPFALPTGIA